MTSCLGSAGTKIKIVSWAKPFAPSVDPITSHRRREYTDYRSRESQMSLNDYQFCKILQAHSFVPQRQYHINHEKSR